MAKKKESLSPEEMLQDALVPDWEQPYQVPENWVWVKLGSLADDMADGPFGSNLKSEHYTEEKEARIIQLSNISENGWREENTKYTTFKHAYTISRSIVSPGDIVIAKMMPAGRAIIVPNNEQMYVLSSDVIKMVPTRVVSTQFLVRGINCTFFRNQVQENTQGITRARTSIGKLKEYAFPLPPFAEQQRIVDRIESLLSKLDEAKEKTQKALDSFENRKAAILHKALTGELTKKWREENGVGLESWERHSLNSFCYSIFDGDHMPPPKNDSGIPFLVISNVNNGYLSFENTRFVPEEYYEKLSETRKPRLGDVLYTIVGSFGIPVLVDDNRRFCFQRHMALLKPRNIESKLLWYLLQTEDAYQKAREIATGTAQLTVPIKGLRELVFSIPSLLEQTEIVRILDSIFEKEQKAKELYNVIDKINLMKKAILARAFRGELGTNDPNEESMKELLKSIHRDRIDIVPVAKEKGKVKKKECVFILEGINVPKTILEALSEHKSLTPEKLKAQTGIKDIDDFYAELKKLVDTGAVIERREGDESYLEVNDADRQA